MAVEAPAERVGLIRVAGPLDRSAAAGLLRLVDAQMALVSAGRRRMRDLVVDLEGVGSFEPGGLETLRHARHSTAGRGVRIHLVGCSRRFHLLPLRASRILGEFSTFPTVEIALADLAGATTTSATDTPARAGRADGGGEVFPSPRCSTESVPPATERTRAVADLAPTL